QTPRIANKLEEDDCMAKKRVYEYAKERNISSKDVIEKAKQLGINYGSHMSSMEPDEVEKLNHSEKKSSPKQQKPVEGRAQKEKTTEQIKVKPKTPSKSKEAKINKTEDKQTIKSANNPNKNKPTAQAQPEKREAGHGQSQNNQNRSQGQKNFNAPGNKGNRKNRRGNRRGKQKSARSQVTATPRKFRELPEVLVYTDGMTVAQLAKKLHREAAEIVKKLFLMGVPATQNQSLDKSAIELLAADYGIEAEEKV